MRSIIIVLILGTSLYASGPVMQQPSTTGRQWEVYELTFNDSTSYQNPFRDVNTYTVFTSPSDSKFKINGFYYDTFEWKTRFAPTEPGQWKFTTTFMRPQDTTVFSGSFSAMNSERHGFIRVSALNPNMFSYTDGTTYFPIGADGHTPAITAAYLGIPAGSQQVSDMWDSLQAHGVNTYRLYIFNQDAFADSLSWNPDEGMANLVYHTDSLDMYNLRVGKLMDRWFQQAQAHNINIYLNMFVLFDVSEYPFNTSPWSASNGGPFADINAPYSSATGPGAELEKKYYTYIVSRWGAYRNLFAWEYNNEYGFYSMPPWIAMVDSVIKANDPYGRPHSVSFWNYSYSSRSPVDSLAGVDITDDHLYAFNGWTESDIDSAANAQSVARYRQYTKPVMFGEFGSDVNTYGPSWLRYLRSGYWAAFVGGGYPLLWWCGDQSTAGYAFDRSELQIVTAASKLVATLGAPSTLRPANNVTSTNLPQSLRAYTMKGDSDVVVYVRAFTSDTTEMVGVSLKLYLPGIAGHDWEAAWLDPGTGDSTSTTLGTSAGDTLTIRMPAFRADMLLHLKAAGAPTAMKGNNQGTPSVFALEQNYPNPFNPSTIISYRLPLTGHVMLKIYDILGREVATLVNEVERPGRYSVEFNGSRFASGVYFYRIVAAGNGGERFSSAKKFILMK